MSSCENHKNIQRELQRYYSLWKDGNAMYEEWAKAHGLSSNGVLVLYSLHNDNGECTQKSISQKWCIPKQTVNTILKDFLNKGYVEMTSDLEDKRNKLVCLTESGKEFAGDIIAKLQNRETYVIEKMGLENIIVMNNNTELFIKLFKSGGNAQNER